MNRIVIGNLRNLQSTATTRVVAANASANKSLPMIDMHVVDDHHHDHDHKMALPNRPIKNSSPLGIHLGVANSFTKSVQVRRAHTDIKVPDFSDYRNATTMNPVQNSKANDDDKKTLSYISTFSVGLATAYTAKAIVHDIVANIAPSADVLAMAKIEVNLNEIPEGKTVVMKWRSKPLFIKHRTAAEIEGEQGVDVSTLRDPQTDDSRVQKPEWLVLLGICTHLGCVPLPNAGDFNGYFCPCHGSHYDNSGRIRKGPAPLNLEVPPYSFADGDVLVVG